MTAHAGNIPAEAAFRRARWPAERLFYTGFTLALITAVVLGFSRTFFLRHWYPDWARAHGPPETFFYIHGAIFTAWLLLLLAQTSLVATGRVHIHRRLGWLGATLAVAMVVAGVVASLMAARRPGGFINVPVPGLQFLTVPLSVIVLFALFVGLAFATRRRSQYHKRFMLLATLALAEAAIARWPFAFMHTPTPVPGISGIELCLDLFLVPLIIWDFRSRGRLHRVTLWGGLAILVSQPLRFLISGTGWWLAFAGWAVNLLPA
jgi:hypothetical protein